MPFKPSEYLHFFSGNPGDKVEVTHAGKTWVTELSRGGDDEMLRIKHPEFNTWLYLHELARHEGWFIAHTMDDLVIKEGWVGPEEAAKFPDGSRVLIRRLDRPIRNNNGLEVCCYFRTDWINNERGYGRQPTRFLLIAKADE